MGNYVALSDLNLFDFSSFRFRFPVWVHIIFTFRFRKKKKRLDRFQVLEILVLFIIKCNFEIPEIWIYLKADISFIFFWVIFLNMSILSPYKGERVFHGDPLCLESISCPLLSELSDSCKTLFLFTFLSVWKIKIWNFRVWNFLSFSNYV